MQRLDNTGRDKISFWVTHQNDRTYETFLATYTDDKFWTGHNPAPLKAAILDWNARVMQYPVSFTTFQQIHATNQGGDGPRRQQTADSGVWQDSPANYPITGRCTLTATNRVTALLQDAAE